MHSSITYQYWEWQNFYSVLGKVGSESDPLTIHNLGGKQTNFLGSLEMVRMFSQHDQKSTRKVDDRSKQI